jgi:hypothetical protein
VLPGFNAPVPGSAPSRAEEQELGIGPYARSETAPDGTRIDRYGEDEMAKYFDGRIADDYFEDPSCAGINERICWGYVSLDALYWDRVNNSTATIARDAGLNRTILGAFEWNDWEVVPRLTGGWVFDNGWALEGTYLYKDDLDSNQSVTEGQNVDMTVYGSPGPLGAFGFFNADTVYASDSVALQSGEVNMVQTNNYFNVIAGFRWLELQDRLRILATGVNGNAYTSLSTYNNLFGGQLGFRMSQTYMGIYGIEAQVKAGYYVNYGHLNTQIINAGAGLPNQTRYARSNSDAFMGEAEIMATYNPRIWFQMRLGVQIFTIMKTALAQDQIFESNFTGVGMTTGSDLTYWGPFGGVELMW